MLTYYITRNILHVSTCMLCKTKVLPAHFPSYKTITGSVYIPYETELSTRTLGPLGDVTISGKRNLPAASKTSYMFMTIGQLFMISK